MSDELKKEMPLQRASASNEDAVTFGEGVGLLDRKNHTTNVLLPNEQKVTTTAPPNLPWLIPGLGISHLRPFLDSRDRARLAVVSLDNLDWVREVERELTPGEWYPQRIVRLPGVHHNRNKYREQGARFFQVCPGHGLVASEDHFRQGRSFPILSPDGSRFLKLRGIIGGNEQYPGHFPEVIFIRILYAAIRAPLSVLGCCGIVGGCVYGAYLDHKSRITAEKRDAKRLSHQKKSESPAPFTNFRNKEGIEWADACNPCGTEPEIGINDSMGSFIQPFGLTNEQIATDDISCITAQGECNKNLFNCDLFPRLFIWIGMGTVCSPCAVSSCIGFICGCGHGAVKDCQVAEEPLSLAPQAQRMI